MSAIFQGIDEAVINAKHYFIFKGSNFYSELPWLNADKMEDFSHKFCIMETFKLAQSVHRTSGVCQNNLGEKMKYFGVRKGQQEEI